VGSRAGVAGPAHVPARRFDNLNRLYDVINELDPTWRTPYLMADALITFQIGQPSYDDLLKARSILERGVQALPNDAEIWLNLGQFVAFVAPSTYLDDVHPEESQRWRADGARMLARAAELGAGELSFVTWQAIGGAGILEKPGARRGDSLPRAGPGRDRRPKLRDYIGRRLASLKGERPPRKRGAWRQPSVGEYAEICRHQPRDGAHARTGGRSGCLRWSGTTTSLLVRSPGPTGHGAWSAAGSQVVSLPSLRAAFTRPRGPRAPLAHRPSLRAAFTRPPVAGGLLAAFLSS